MEGNLTFTIIKPDAVAAGYIGKILDMIIGAGFSIRALRMKRLTRSEAGKFYAVHTEKPFFHGLVEFMTSGPVVLAVIEKNDAVAQLRQLAGTTDPASAAPGTIRNLFGSETRRNAIHASDSNVNARVEWEQFFGPDEIFL